jgi:short-subunit dehydrogenase
MIMLVKACLPILEQRERALILNISSLGSLVPFPGQTAYSASKAAVRIFSEGLSAELRGSSVDVAVVMPGAMKTGIVQNSPFLADQAKAKLQAFSKVPGIALTADRAARKILSATRKGRRRIVLGGDAWILEKCYRVAPVTTTRLLHLATRSMREDLRS